MDDYHVWGSQVIYDNETAMYHMFASIYPGDQDFYNIWLTQARIVRAVSPNITGPFVYADMVLDYHPGPASDPGRYWDRSVMNPKIVRAQDGTYLLFYTGDSYNQTQPPTNSTILQQIQGRQRIGMAYSKSILGPFTRVPYPVLDVCLMCGT